MRVNKANMRLVVAALRSGKYLQGRGRLKCISNDGTPIGYCCMGVMCEVAIEKGVELDVQFLWLNDFSRAVRFDGSPTFLRTKVIEWLGVHDNGEPDQDLVIGKDGNEMISAAYANDELKWDFKQIAASMEAYYGLLEDDDEPELVD